MDTNDFDVAIIGGGVAGMSAALWCDELGLDAILLESKSELGGQLLRTYNSIENHLGVRIENGRKLRDSIFEQIKDRNFAIRFNAKLDQINFKERKILTANSESLAAKAIVIATGVRRRKLGIKGEEHFKGKGILESGKRDKDLVTGKRVLIVGGGDAALENAQILSETASEIFIAHRRKEFRARQEFISKAEQIEKVNFLKETELKEIRGQDKIESVVLENSNNKESFLLAVDAILFRIGVEPNAEFLNSELELDNSGYVKVNSLCETNRENFYAIGDIANPTSPTISSAVGMGATAVKAIYAKRH